MSNITSTSNELDYAFTTTLSNQLAQQDGYKLELGKEYTVYVTVAGNFKTKKWGFKITPTKERIDFTQPQEYSPT